MASGNCGQCGQFFKCLMTHYAKSPCGARIAEAEAERRCSKSPHQDDTRHPTSKDHNVGDVPSEIQIPRAPLLSGTDELADEDGFPEGDDATPEDSPTPPPAASRLSFVPRRIEGKRAVNVPTRYREYLLEQHKEPGRASDAMPKISNIHVEMNEDLASRLTAPSNDYFSSTVMSPLDLDNMEDTIPISVSLSHASGVSS